MYGKKEWEENIFGLSSYEKYFTCSNKRQPMISPGNFPKGVYEQIITAIRENTLPE